MNYYENGYGKPPKHTRYKSGQSGNPKGRPKRRKTWSTLLYEGLNEELNIKVKIKEGQKVMSATKMRVVLKKLVQDAMNGKPHALKMLLRYIEIFETYFPKLPEKLIWSKEKEQLLQEILNDTEDGE